MDSTSGSFKLALTGTQGKPFGFTDTSTLRPTLQYFLIKP